eukprot:TRINITY_DN31139_c0_g1_i1.p2 TRINITY_DN31139_c0_g1~~TRINITY_DN31139_c0_g1_i1.p2  ORF type:complete len:138 (+),score=12.64 TRINITY_DN31139_c0_g1_i1:430-843(+)
MSGKDVIRSEKRVLDMPDEIWEQQNVSKIDRERAPRALYSGHGGGHFNIPSADIIPVNNSLIDGIETSLQLNNISALTRPGKHVPSDADAGDDLSAAGLQLNESIAQKEGIHNFQLNRVLCNNSSVVQIATHNSGLS